MLKMHLYPQKPQPNRQKVNSTFLIKPYHSIMKLEANSSTSKWLLFHVKEYCDTVNALNFVTEVIFYWYVLIAKFIK